MEQTVRNPIHRQGYSSDVKHPAEDGSTLHILDTGEMLVCHEGAWIPDLRLVYALKCLNLITQ